MLTEKEFINLVFYFEVSEPPEYALALPHLSRTIHRIPGWGVRHA